MSGLAGLLAWLAMESARVGCNGTCAAWLAGLLAWLSWVAAWVAGWRVSRQLAGGE